jgi:hypothetical protein
MTAFVFCISVTNGQITFIAEITSVIKENGCNALHLPPYHLDLNSVRVVCLVIKIQNSTRMHVCEFEGNTDFCRKYLLHTEKNGNVSVPT